MGIPVLCIFGSSFITRYYCIFQERSTVPASQLAEKEQELNVFMEKALVDRRQLAEKYKEARDKLKQLEQQPSVVSCRSLVFVNLCWHATQKRKSHGKAAYFSIYFP